MKIKTKMTNQYYNVLAKDEFGITTAFLIDRLITTE